MFSDEILQDVIVKCTEQAVPIEYISIVLHEVNESMRKRGITLNGIST